MGKLVQVPLGQPGYINALFTGFLEDESGYFSDASLYEHDDDGSEDEIAELESNLDSRDVQVFKQTKTCVTTPAFKNKLQSKLAKCSLKDRKNCKIADRKADGDKDGVKQLLENQKTKKGCMRKAENKAQSETYTEVKSEQEMSPLLEKPPSLDRLVNRQYKLSKKQRAQAIAESKKQRAQSIAGLGEHGDASSASSHDSEADVKVQKKVEKSAEVMSKKRQTVLVKAEYGTEITREKARDERVKEENLPERSNLREADAENGVTAIKAFQRRKKLCKAVELASAAEKGHKGKGKGMVNGGMEMKGRTQEKSGPKAPITSKGNNSSFLGGMGRKKSEVHTSDSDATPVTAQETRKTTSPTKYSKQGSPKHKEQKLVKDEDGLMRAGISLEGRPKSLAKKSPSSMGHSVKGPKHKEILEYEDIPRSLSTTKRAVCTEHHTPAVTDARLKGGQAVKDFCASLETVHSVVEHQRPAVEKDGDNGVAGEEVSSGVTEGGEVNKEHMTDEKGDGSSNAITDVGWVLCDNCRKWRSIPASLADTIEATNCGWLCKDNPNKKFADCSVPQEKSNAEINAELNISEVSFCEEGDGKDPPIDSKFSNGLQRQSRPQATWTLIKHNIFQHRHRKTQTVDEQMVCGCVPPEDGGVGCGEDCLNHMLSIECVSQTCPCGDVCSNQQFQRRLYTKVGWFRCGKKGFGLQVLQNVSMGAFIIEYVGEVLEMAAYEARQKEYALRGQKHFYFMTLNSSEVIDACVKGNLGRFINHSCEPNCRTEKWMVNGEVCIGLFAIRDLRKGEEITFDYNYVRVCGAAAKKCLCGSRECRGFIGGDPMTPHSIVESDSDEEDPEPIMIEESFEEDWWIEGSKLNLGKKPLEKVEVGPPHELPDTKRIWMLSESSEKKGANLKQVKTKSSARKSGFTKRLTIETSGGRFEGVEERLNELLDENGGLCKGQCHAEEAATHYLKLLVVTAASGDTVNGEASRSTRDLSMVLDALLKTQSRAILMGIVNKNGLQILHNMIKQSKKDYKKTPISRKLLKVLEFLAIKRILTAEQINSEPLCHGAESVRDTIFQLCRHADTEVQQIARRFRENWLNRNFSRNPQRGGQGLSSEHPIRRLFRRQNQHDDAGTDGDISIKNSTAIAHDEVTRKRKRPSRWDQPSQEVLDTTLAGGLPQSFWPFNANNLLLGNSQQSGVPDRTLRQTESALSDELGTTHPGPPLFPAIDLQHHAVAVHTGTHLPGVVSGIPVEQFMASSSTGFISQQGSVCVGIPVAQFHGAHTSGSDCSYFPQMFNSSHQMNHTGDGQAMPLSSRVLQLQEHKPPENEVEPPDQAGEEPNVTFGVSPSQFFQQMHGLFGSSFHPWQLQVLMAPHAWGPYLSGDARIRVIGSLNESGPVCWSSEFNGLEESVATKAEPGGALGYELEPEPPVPGLSPPPPPARPIAFPSPLSAQSSKPVGGRQNMGKEHLGRGNMPNQQGSPGSWKPYRSNSPRWSKFRGHKHRNFGYRRDFGYYQRNNRQNFPRQGPSSRPHSNKEDAEDASHWQHSDRNWAYSNSRAVDSEEFMDTETDGEPYGVCHNQSFEDTGNPTTTMLLERPWGYGQEEYSREDVDNYPNTPGEFRQERGVDARNSRSVDN